jgi:hypothetical protein
MSVNKTQTAGLVNKEFGYSKQKVRLFLTAWGHNSEDNPLTIENLDFVKNYFERTNQEDLKEIVEKDLTQLIENQSFKSKPRT